MPFSHIVGCENQVSYLRRLVDGNIVPHALLFSGPEGSSKLDLSIAFAQYLLCEDRQDGNSCGKCTGCTKSFKWQHPDLHFSYPVVASGKTDTSDPYLPQWREMLEEHPYFNAFDWFEKIGGSRKQGNISKNECQNILRKLGLKAYESDYKIMIIWMPEFLNKDGNRLLKIIEEPPARTVIMLVSENVEQLLPTIISRCQSIHVGPGEASEIQEYLIAKGLQADRAEVVARTVEGNLREALHATSDDGILFREQFLQWLKICFKGDMTAALAFSDQMAKASREEIKQFLRFALQFFERVLYKQNGLMSADELNGNEGKAVEWLSERISIHGLESLVTDCTLGYQYVLHNVNERLLFTNLSIRMRDCLLENSKHTNRTGIGLVTS
jgi:DNA polymerase-3 subunit delta'